MRVNVLRLVLSIIICQLAGAVGSVFTYPSIGAWYAGLVKPFFTPPNWLFAPVWITLFLLMGISLYLVWEKGFGKNRTALYLFSLQLVLNILWSVLFFGLQCPLCALPEIIILWIAILLTAIYFYRIRKTASYLLAPYLIWVIIAGLLNYYIWMLNA